jgi:hypothetical protein
MDGGRYEPEDIFAGCRSVLSARCGGPRVPLVIHLYPYSLAIGLLGDVSVFLWLLVMGVNVRRWKEQAIAAQCV